MDRKTKGEKMEELFNILKDIKSGALPLHEIPGFIAWSFRKTMWFWVAVTFILVIWFIK